MHLFLLRSVFFLIILNYCLVVFCFCRAPFMISFLKIFFSFYDFLQKGLVVMNFLSFCLSGNLLNSLSLMKNIFAGFWNSWLIFFPFSTVTGSPLSLRFWWNTFENLVEDLLCMVTFSSHWFQNSLFISDLWCFEYSEFWCEFLKIHPIWTALNILIFIVTSFIKYTKLLYFL